MQSMQDTIREHPEYINYAHAAVVAPVLGYIGWMMKKTADGKSPAADLRVWAVVLMVVSVIVLIYHGHRAYERMKAAEEAEAKKNESGVKVGVTDTFCGRK